MKRIWFGSIIIGTAFITTISCTILVSYQKSSQVLSWIAPTPTSTPIPTPTPTPTPTIKPTPKPTRIPTPTQIPIPTFSSEQIYNYINQYAGEYGVDPNIMRYMAQCESGFNPLAKHSIYAGLFQYDGATWKSFRKLQGLDPHPDLRFHAQEAVRTTAYLLSQNRAYLWPNCIP